MGSVRPVNGSHWGFVKTLLRPHHRAFALYGLLLAIATSLPILGSLVLARFVALVVDGAGMSRVAPLGLGYAALGLASSAVEVLVTWRSTQLAWRVTNQLRNDLVNQVLEADLSFHRDRTPGELLTRCDADVTSLTNFLSSVVSRIIGIVLLAVASTIVLAFVEPRLAIVLAAGYLALGWTMWRVRDLSADSVVAERRIDAEMSSVAEQYLAGAEDVAALGAGAHGLRRFGSFAEQLVDAAGVRTRDVMRVQAAIKSVMAMVMVAVLAVGGIGLHFGWLEIAGVLLAFRLVQIVRSPVEHLTWRLQEAQGVSGAARRVLELVDERRSVVAGTSHLPDGPLDVVFENVELVYDDSVDGSAALTDLELRIAPGEVLGLIGRTGSGKTTVARLLLRLVAPSSGRVVVGGVDAAMLDDDAFRTRVVAIPQDVQLFPGSVRDNVSLFARVDDHVIVSALEQAGLKSWLDGLPRGLDTILTADGRDDSSADAATSRTGLSAGQAQLLAIARALLPDPAIIVLDEATSRVDPMTQEAIGLALSRLVRGRTAVIIAHRLETLEMCDTIAVLSNGVLEEHGRRLDLAADPSSHYATLLAVGASSEELA